MQKLAKDQLIHDIENGIPLDPELLIQGAPVVLSILDVIFGKKRKLLEQEIVVLKQLIHAIAQVNAMQDLELKSLQSEIEGLKDEIIRIGNRA